MTRPASPPSSARSRPRWAPPDDTAGPKGACPWLSPGCDGQDRTGPARPRSPLSSAGRPGGAAGSRFQGLFRIEPQMDSSQTQALVDEAASLVAACSDANALANPKA